MTSDADKRRLVNLTNESTDKEFSWIKQCLSILAIILGLIVSLRTDNAANIYEYIAFISTLSFCGLCILVGLAFLYSDHDTSYRLASKFDESITKRGDYTNGDKQVEIAPKKIFGTLRVCFFVLLVLSILSLICLASISNLPVCNLK